LAKDLLNYVFQTLHVYDEVVKFPCTIQDTIWEKYRCPFPHGYSRHKYLQIWKWKAPRMMGVHDYLLTS